MRYILALIIAVPLLTLSPWAFAGELITLHPLPKFQGSILPINNPVHIRYEPFPKSPFTKNSHFEIWTGGNQGRNYQRPSREIKKSVSSGTLEARSQGDNGTLYIATVNENNATFSFRINATRKLLTIESVTIGGRKVDMSSTEVQSQLGPIEKLFRKFMPQYDVSKIVVGGKLFDGGIQYLGAQISLEMVALGLSRYEDRNVLVTDLEGDINVSGGSGIVKGYALIDLATGMAVLQNSYMSIQIGKTNIKGNEIQKLSLPPIEANQIEVSGSKTTSKSTTSSGKSIYCKRRDGTVFVSKRSENDKIICGGTQEITKAEYDRLKGKKKDTASTTGPDTASSGDDPLEAKLERLKKLLEKGLITEEEAAAKRAKLLEDM